MSTKPVLLGLILSLGLLGTACVFDDDDANAPPEAFTPITAPAPSDPNAPSTPSGPAVPGPPDPTPSPTSCAIDGQAAVKIAEATDATDLQLVHGRAYFTSQRALHRVNLAAVAAPNAVIAAPDTGYSTTYFVDTGSAFDLRIGHGCYFGSRRLIRDFELETQLHSGFGGCVGSSGGQPQTQQKDLHHLFGSDDLGFYVAEKMSDESTRFSRYNNQTGPTTGTNQALFREEREVADPQVSKGHFYWVANKRVVMEGSNSTPAPQTPKRIATTEGCRLAVGATHAFCSTPLAIVSHPLAGGDPATVLELTQSKSKAQFGAAVLEGEALIVASSDPAEDAGKHVLREVKLGAPATERILACGHEKITSVAANATHVVFAEQGKGVFAVTR